MDRYEESLENFSSQIRYAVENYKAHGYKVNEFSNIVMGGLGGSGIGARITRASVIDRCPIPVEVFSDYSLPAYANEKTLVILSSYSGNTEETLAMYEEAVSLNCRIMVMAAGGKLLESASAAGHYHLMIEGGLQPRMALGYSISFLQLLFAELLDEDVKDELLANADELDNSMESHIEVAKHMMNYFKLTMSNKFIVISDRNFEQVALRFCQQLQENAKHEGFVCALPELSHNVIESFYGKVPSNFIFIRTELHDRVTARFDFLASLLERENNKIYIMDAPDYDLQAIFELIYQLDWFTVLLAQEKGVNPLDITNIVSLKEYLSQIN